MDYRKEVLDFVMKMKESNVNLLAISEKSISNIDDIKYDPEDFLFDGLIILMRIIRTEKSSGWFKAIFKSSMVFQLL